MLLGFGNILLQKMSVHFDHMFRETAASFENFTAYFTTHTNMFIIVARLNEEK